MLQILWNHDIGFLGEYLNKIIYHILRWYEEHRQGAAPAAREGGVCGSLPGDAVVSGSGELNPATLQNGYMLCRFPSNATGFLRIRIRCAEPCTVYVQGVYIL